VICLKVLCQCTKKRCIWAIIIVLEEKKLSNLKMKSGDDVMHHAKVFEETVRQLNCRTKNVDTTFVTIPEVTNLTDYDGCIMLVLGSGASQHFLSENAFTN